MAGHMYNGRETELLIPASSLEVLKIAVIFGADAVYIGGEAFGLRAKAKNFSIEDMKEGVKFAHERNVKVYVTANILAHNYDLEGARAYFEELKEVGPDALIISDPGMFTIAKEVLPDIDIHISTQANNTNYMTYNFWWNQGAKRWRLRHSCMERCVYLIQEDACYQASLQEEMLTGEHVHIHAVGNMLLLRRTDRDSSCLYMRMREEHIYLTLRIYV